MTIANLFYLNKIEYREKLAINLVTKDFFSHQTLTWRDRKPAPKSRCKVPYVTITDIVGNLSNGGITIAAIVVPPTP
ncbi:MAG: hypothetical protein V7L27_05775 [Nostoc sp.]|uniref:hypothetical protein n=1 Tax=Nostoc sp. TaxID=1180 RepID=UPI002FF4463E